MNPVKSVSLSLCLAASASFVVNAQREPLVRSYSSAHPGPERGQPEQIEIVKPPAPTPTPPPAPVVDKTYGSIERNTPDLDQLLAPGTAVELVAEGFHWAEGPVWVKHGGYLLFSDVPENRMYKWVPGKGATVFMDPSGYDGLNLKFSEPGSNGLTVDKGEHLVFCQHGNKRIARLNARGEVEPLAETYRWRRFNSPNDLVFARNGNLYFTDPPYGMEGLNNSPLKELMFNGVYLLRPGGEVVLLTSKLTFPNGIVLAPDEKKLYVNVSDADKPVTMVYNIQGDGTIDEGQVFFDAKPLTSGRKGLPDGMKADMLGNLWSTGPGGVLIISPEGKLLGTINTGVPTGNCAWGMDGSTLFIAAEHRILKVHALVKGYGPWNDRLAAQR